MNSNTCKTIHKSRNKEDVVLAFLDKKGEHNKLYYLVQFYSNSEDETVWIHKSELNNCKKLLSLFNKKQLGAIISKLD